LAKLKKSWPFLRVSLQVVEHTSAAVGGTVLAAPPTLAVSYANDGSTPSYTAYLITYWWKLGAAGTTGEHQEHRRELLTLQPGTSGSFDYPLPTFAPLHKPQTKLSKKTPLPTASALSAPVKYKMVSMIFDPLSDPLALPAEEWFSSPSPDRHVAVTGDLASWPLP
jgi:hypothetical protein